jgi:hypothetical protein
MEDYQSGPFAEGAWIIRSLKLIFNDLVTFLHTRADDFARCTRGVQSIFQAGQLNAQGIQFGLAHIENILA